MDYIGNTYVTGKLISTNCEILAKDEGYSHHCLASNIVTITITNTANSVYRID